MDSYEKSNILAHLASLIAEQDKIAIKALHSAKCLTEVLRRLKEEFQA